MKCSAWASLVVAAIAGPVLAADTAPAEAPPEVRLIAPDGGPVAPFPGGLPPEMQLLQERLQQMQVPGGPLDPEKMRKLQLQIFEDMQRNMNGVVIQGGRVGGEVGGPPIVFQMAAPKEVKLEKAAFLGVTTSAPAAALREQLQLPKGAGLVVDFVEKDSPAEAAGLKEHDVITKFDEQILINAQQLAVLVRTKKPGDSVSLSIIRGGKAEVLTAKLVEKEVPVLDEGNPWMVPNFQVVKPGAAGGAIVPGRVMVDPAGKWVKGQSLSVKSNPDGSTTKTLRDGEGELELTTLKDGTATLVVKDSEGKEVFSGPVNTEEERKELPEGVSEKLTGMQRKIVLNKMPRGMALQIVPNGAEMRGGGRAAAVSTVSQSDGEYEIVLKTELTAEGEKKIATVREVKTGKVVFDGEITTAEQRKALPPEIAAKISKLETKVETKVETQVEVQPQ